MRAAAGLGSEDLGDLSDLTSQSEGELGAARYVDDAEEPQSPDAQPQSAPPEAGPSETVRMGEFSVPCVLIAIGGAEAAARGAKGDDAA